MVDILLAYQSKSMLVLIFHSFLSQKKFSTASNKNEI